MTIDQPPVFVYDGSVDPECHCAQGSYESYDGPQRDCPVHGECVACRSAFDPADSRFDGAAQSPGTPWCKRCVDRCHESTDFAHVCAVCQP